jgi:hypothetical protein
LLFFEEKWQTERKIEWDISKKITLKNIRCYFPEADGTGILLGTKAVLIGRSTTLKGGETYVVPVPKGNSSTLLQLAWQTPRHCIQINYATFYVCCIKVSEPEQHKIPPRLLCCFPVILKE